MANADNDLLIHHLIDSIQRSIDIADKTSKKKYNFALAKMDVKMTLNFEIKHDESESRTRSQKVKHWLSLFSRKANPQNLSNTEDDADNSHGNLTIQMLFKPGGKAFSLSNDDTHSDVKDDVESTDSSDTYSDDDANDDGF